jgi:hypothetical protein
MMVSERVFLITYSLGGNTTKRGRRGKAIQYGVDSTVEFEAEAG